MATSSLAFLLCMVEGGRSKFETKRCEKERCAKHSWSSVLPKTIGIAFWVCLVLVCFIYRDEITVESIVNYTPKNPVFAICITLMLFVEKCKHGDIWRNLICRKRYFVFSPHRHCREFDRRHHCDIDSFLDRETFRSETDGSFGAKKSQTGIASNSFSKE